MDVALADAARTTGSIRSNEAQRGACLDGCVDGLFPLVTIFLEECLCLFMRGVNEEHALLFCRQLFVKGLVWFLFLISSDKGEKPMISPWILIIIIVLGLLWAGLAQYKGRK